MHIFSTSITRPLKQQEVPDGHNIEPQVNAEFAAVVQHTSSQELSKEIHELTTVIHVEYDECK